MGGSTTPAATATPTAPASCCLFPFKYMLKNKTTNNQYTTTTVSNPPTFCLKI